MYCDVYWDSSSSYGIYLFVVLWQLDGVGRVCLPVRPLHGYHDYNRGVGSGSIMIMINKNSSNHDYDYTMIKMYDGWTKSRPAS